MESKKDKKPRVRHEWEHDAIVKKIRAVCPMNRTKLRVLAMKNLVKTFSDEEGNFDYAKFAKYAMEERIEEKISKL